VSALRAVTVVALGCTGLVVAMSALPRFRRPTLRRRLTPYLGAVGPRRSSLLEVGAPASGAAAVLDPVRRALGARLHAVAGDGRDVDARLRASGTDLDASAFRAEQVTWALVGLVAGIALGVLLAAGGRSVSPALVLGLGVVGAVGGVVARDRSLSRAVERRRSAVRAALPTMVDLVCLAVTAGESLRGALELVASTASGPLGDELRRVLRTARGGVALLDALAASGRVLDLAPFDRFVAALGAAQERGVPLADALRTLAFDLRSSSTRELIEVAGRKQVSMLVPVVVLILPVAMLFAFYPGVVAIRTLAR
jgi:tight adherence protein C